MPTVRSNVDSGPAALPLDLSGGSFIGVVVTDIVVTYNAALQDAAYEAGVDTLVGATGAAGGAPGARTLTYAGLTVPLSFDNEFGGLMRLIEGLAKSDRVVSGTSVVITLAL